MGSSSAVTGGFAFLLLSLGVVEIVLTRHAESLTKGFEDRGTSDLRGPLSGDVNLNLLPKHYKRGPTWSILAAGVVTMVTGLVGLIGAVWGSRRAAGSNTFYKTFATGFFGTLSLVVTLVALIYSMVAQSNSSTWRFSGPETLYGQYTVEGWACQMKDVIIGRQDAFNKVCMESMAARFITIPLLVLCGVSLALASLGEVKARRANARNVPTKDHELDSI